MAHQTPNSYKIPEFFIIVVDGCIIRSSCAILLSERVFNSYNLILYVLKAIADKSLFQGIGYKTKQVFIRSSYYYYCKKPICMRCTVTQLAHESVGLCPLSWFVHEGIWLITQQSSKQDYKNNSCTQFAREDVGLCPF